MNKKIVVILLAGALVTPVLYFGWIKYQSHRKDQLIEASRIYWDARAANDFQTAYQLEAATFAGFLAPDEVETRHFHGVRIISYELGDVDVSGDGAEVVIKMSITAPFSAVVRDRAPFRDHWTWMDGKWLHGYPTKGGSGLERDPAPGVLKAGQMPDFMQGGTATPPTPAPGL